MDSFTLPTALGDLLDADRVIVQQHAISKDRKRYEILNRYEVMVNSPSNTWKHLLELEEQSSFRSRLFCFSARPFRMRGSRNGQGMLMLNRPLRCPANIGCSCPHQLYVNLIDGTPIGSIVQKPSCSQNVFHLMDADNEPQLVIKGPWLAYHCCLDLAFKVYSIKGGRSIGRVIRQWREGKDMFHIAFPLDLHVLLKLLLLNAAVLIDFLYFGSH